MDVILSGLIKHKYCNDSWVRVHSVSADGQAVGASIVPRSPDMDGATMYIYKIQEEITERSLKRDVGLFVASDIPAQKKCRFCKISYCYKSVL